MLRARLKKWLLGSRVGLATPDDSVRFEVVLKEELAAIKRRRTALNERFGNFSASSDLPEIKIPDPSDPSPPPPPVLDVVGLSLSGGGIRSASFCLGVVQALDSNSYASAERKKQSDKASPTSLLNRIDYLSTVSGGGYIGTSLTGGLSNRRGVFPFESERDQGETSSVQHIRDYSNYLFPNGWLDVLDSFVLYLRGLIVNLVMITWPLLILVLATLWFYPSANDLAQANFKYTTISFFGLLVLFMLWALVRSFWNLLRNTRPIVWLVDKLFSMRVKLSGIKPTGWKSLFTSYEGVSETSRPSTRFYGLALILLLFIGFFELQPFVLAVLHEKEKGEQTFFAAITQSAVALWTVGAAVVSFFAARLERFIKLVEDGASFGIRFAAITSKITILFASAAVPLLIWLCYLKLCLWGMAGEPPNWFSAIADCLAWLQKLPGVHLVPTVFSSVGQFFSRLFGTQDLAAINSLTATFDSMPVAKFYLVVAFILLVWAIVIRPNDYSLHRLYRDRLSRAFVFFVPLEVLPTKLTRAVAGIIKYFMPKHVRRRVESAGKGEPLSLDTFKLSALSDEHAPLHIINAALNIQASKYVNKRSRDADFFMFSKNYIGSDATRYLKTSEMEKIDPRLDLATAMAISGAAASSSMGSSTIRTLTPTLTILNVSLGYWLRNPKWKSLVSKLSRWWLRVYEWFNVYFYLELFGRLDEDRWAVYLTDGGHIENLGLYALLRRRCRLIIVVDAEFDPQMNFNSLIKAERYARIDLGVRIDLPWTGVRTSALEAGPLIAESSKGIPDILKSGPHCAVGRIAYRNDLSPNADEDEGYIVYVKSSLSGDENDYIRDYKRRYPNYPHESTSDQLFSEEQLEVYRSLGWHIAKRFFDGRDNALVLNDSGQWTLQRIFANERSLKEIRKLLSIPDTP